MHDAALVGAVQDFGSAHVTDENDPPDPEIWAPNVQMIRFYWLASRKTLVVRLANGNPCADEREQGGVAPAAKGPDAA